jgi:protein-arginine kinase activator protein McsA
MSFIEEIQPYIERIKLHQQGGNITNIETLRAIRDIHFKYIRFKDFDTPSNLGCGNCVRQMINQLVGEIGRESKGKKMKFPKQEPKEIKQLNAIVKADKGTSHLRWGVFKKYCTSKGLKVKGKTREVLENELKGL